MTTKDDTPITRRQALGAIGSAAATAATLIACRSPAERGPGAGETRNRPMNKARDDANKRMPTVFLPHGGGPWPFIDESVFGKAGMWDEMEAYMKGLSMVPPSAPTAVLMISAHWEAPVPTLQTAAEPPMLYDYGGFPAEAYEVQWPAPGQPALAARVRDLLEGAGIASGEDGERGFDHGTFVPMKLAWPQADVPTLQLSLKRGLDPETHLDIGRAIAPLRDEGVFIVGSGMSYHNMRNLRRSMRGDPAVLDESRAFDDWLAASMDLEPSRRATRLIEWEQAPKARQSHPREEHLLPLMVVAGAAGDDAGSLPYRDKVMGVRVSAVHFG